MKRTRELLVGLVLGVVPVLTIGCGGATPDADSDSQSEAEARVIQTEVTANALTKKQASTVLKLIDDICGDTWCEGDHNFHFDQIQCSRPCDKTPGTCRVWFRMFPYDSDPTLGESYARSCKTANFTGFASLVETAPNGYQSLDWQFYDALSACISELEGQLPPL